MSRHLNPECGTLEEEEGEAIPPLLILRKTEMKIEYKDFGLYTIDVNYLKHLHDDVDQEVRFDANKAYDRKPFLGIIVTIDTYTYFIPLTSSKPKHAKWKNVDKSYYLIYEIIDKVHVRPYDIVKPFSDTQVLKVLSALDIKKMIPVPNGYYSRIEFSQVADVRYRSLLIKEYLFCLKIQDGILEKAKTIYEHQKNTGKVYPLFCNFVKLESACANYGADKNKDDSVNNEPPIGDE